jgi:hypothetical protein
MGEFQGGIAVKSPGTSRSHQACKDPSPRTSHTLIRGIRHHHTVHDGKTASSILAAADVAR